MSTPFSTRIFFAAIYVLLCIQLKSQSMLNYASTRSTGIAYNSINLTGSAFPTWRNTSTFTQDDNRSDFVNIGFDFWYFGTRYTQFCVSTNGFLDFSSSTDDGGPLADDFGFDNAAFSNSNAANGTFPAIAPFYDDLTAQGGSAALGNSIKYKLTGSAPNRTLTVEWSNMAVYTNTSPSLNFQVMLVESTGVVIINYGTMNTGTFTFSYSMGLNQNGQTTAAFLKELQTVNTNNFSNTVQTNLSAMPVSNSRYSFTPPVPAAASGALTFSGVSSSGMTLNWTNWATNEVGYVIYNSTDGVNYNFVTQTAANATSAAVTGLLSGTAYYWKLYAVTEGCLSSALTGTQSTSPGGNKISVVSGNWSAAATWSPSGVPASGDNVTISNSNTVSIDVNAQCQQLTVGTGGAAARLQFTGITARSLTAYSNITINSAATFDVATNSNVTHTVYAKGNLTNNGTLNFQTDANSLCNLTFSATANHTLAGTGANTFTAITVSMGSSPATVLDVTASNFNPPANFLTLNNGTLKISSASAVNITPYSASVAIGSTTGLWLNSANCTVNTGAGISLAGNLTVTNGTLNVGNAADEDLLSNGGNVTITGGLVKIAGKYYTTGINNLGNFIQTGGTVIVPAFGSTSTTDAPFQITSAGSTYSITGGIINIQREGGTGAQDLGYVNTASTGNTVTGGTLQIGNASTPASQTISINSTAPIGNLAVSSGSATAKLLTNSLSVISNVSITAGALNANNLNITLGGNWANNTGTFTPGTGVVTFSSSAAQSLFKTGGETFSNLLFTGSGTKTFSSNITATGNFSINAGSTVDVSTANYTLNLAGNFINNGTFGKQKGLVLLNGAASQSIGGSSTTDFYNLSLSNTGGAVLNANANLIGALTLSNGTFNTNGKNFTMVSTATATARIAQITGTGDITGNVIVQRYAPGGTTGWAFLATPISSALTLNDWDDDIYISCSTCPDGSAGGFLSIYTYDETKPGLLDASASYIPLGSINDPIVPGKGYWVYLGTGSLTTTPIIIDVTGTVRKFNYSIPLSYTNYGSTLNDGWNLVHNPYPSPIKWSLLRGATANIDDAIYVYNADLAAYASCVNGISSPAVSAGGISDTIPMCQGFYVHSTGATALTAKEANKVGGNPVFLKPGGTTQSASSVPLLRLYLDKTGSLRDETVIYLQPGANDAFDATYDAYKLPGNDPAAPVIATEKNNDKFQINGIAPISGNFSIPLKTLTGYPGTYSITADNISSFPAGACITLYDKFTGITHNIKASPYVFSLSDTTTVARFNLNITINPLQISSSIVQPSCSAPSAGEIMAKGVNAGPWNYYWKDGNGNPVKTSMNKTTADTLQNINGGSFDLEVNTVGTCDNNSSTFLINPADVTLAQFSCADTVDLSTGGIANFSNSSVNAISYLWDFGDGSANSSAYTPTHTYSNAGTYTVSLICTSGGGCTDTSMKQVIVYNKLVGIASISKADPNLIVKTLGDKEFLIQESFDKPKALRYILTDSYGRLVRDLGETTTNAINLHLDLKSFSSGIYFLTISGEDGKTVVKLPVK